MATAPGTTPPEPPPATLPYPTTAAGVPPDLARLPQWVDWRWVYRPGEKKPWTKPPINPRTGGAGSSTDPATWGTFAQAVARARRDRLDGLGVVLTPELRIVGLDLDGCRSLETGALAEWAAAVVARFPTLWQVSPSGTGLRGFLRGQIPTALLDDRKQGRRAGPIEVYQGGRYLTITDVRAPGSTDAIADCQPELEAWLAEVFPPAPEPAPAPHSPAPAGPVAIDDDELLERMFASKHGDRIRRLWDGDTGAHRGDDNPSSADQALCNHLAFWTDRDETRVDRLFRRSGLYREEKWGRRADYRAATIRKAIASVVEGYAGPALDVELEDVGVRTNGTGHGPSPAPAPPGAGEEEAPPSEPTGPDGHTLDDVGNAERLLARYGERLRYCGVWQKWLVYDGRRWAEDPAACQVGELAIRVVRRMAKDAAGLLGRGDRKGAKRLFAWAAACRSAGKIASMIDTARRFPQAWVTPDELDADDYVLNCTNGTLDLRSGALRPHAPADLLTQLTSVAYDPDAACPVWEQSVDEIFCGDPALVGFVQRAVGMSVTGDIRDHVFPVAYGATGRNGKGLLLNTLVELLGDYGAILPADELMVSQGERHPTGLTMLYRKRLVVASEVEGGRRLAVARVKALSGGDPVTARRMRENFWTFRATHTVWLVTNDKPEIKETKDAIWDRVKLTPFEVYFRDPAKADERPRGTPKRILDKDPDRYRKVAREWPGILAWVVRGCLAWQRDGLAEPPSVAAATTAYRDEQDVLARFIEDRCETGPYPPYRAEATPLYVAYKSWCERTGERWESQTRFGEQLGDHGHGKDRDPVTRRTIRLGLRLLPLPDEEPPPPGASS